MKQSSKKPDVIEKREKANKEHEKAAVSMHMRYRNTYSSPEGQVVLLDLLRRLGYFGTIPRDPEDVNDFSIEEQRIRRNVAVEIIGIVTKAAPDMPEAMFNGLMEFVKRRD
jgi:hypothetical protein